MSEILIANLSRWAAGIGGVDIDPIDPYHITHPYDEIAVWFSEVSSTVISDEVGPLHSGGPKLRIKVAEDPVLSNSQLLTQFAAIIRVIILHIVRKLTKCQPQA
uniref:Uncharacterized protein n=1 Tax=Tetranychus urticae TaxID=32264 RepID=T1KQJ4_TETUR